MLITSALIRLICGIFFVISLGFPHPNLIGNLNELGFKHQVYSRIPESIVCEFFGIFDFDTEEINLAKIESIFILMQIKTISAD